MTGLAIYLIFIVSIIVTCPRATGRWLADVEDAYIKRHVDHRTGP